MNIFVVSLKVVPQKDHPRFFDVGGGLASVWVAEATGQAAAVRAASFIQLARWEVVEVKECQEITPKPDVMKLMQHNAVASLPMDAKLCDVTALRSILEAYRFGFAYHIDFYAPGGEEVFEKMKARP